MKEFSLDFETEFSKELSVTTMGSRAYFDALSLEQIYMVSVVADDGRAWAGHPSDLDWSFVEGSRILVWNAGFEIQGLRRLRDLGIQIPNKYELVDVADMACYVGLPRALKGAAQAALGVKINKGIRDTEMKGKSWLDMDPEFRERVREYAINDSRYTLQIWEKYKHLWPDEERLVSRLSCEWAAGGIGADADAMREAQKTLKHVLWEAGTKLPWFNPDDPKSVPLSPKKLAEQCRDVGIRCPMSLAMDDEDCAAWEDQYGEQYPWVGAMRDYRRANALLKKVEAMERRTFGGRLYFEVKYFGAGMTGRWSGSAGVNMQNISGKVLYGVNCREVIVAPEGKTFIVADLAQIEPRVLLWLVKDTEQLGIIASGVSPYVAHAIATMGVSPDEPMDKTGKVYKLAKFRSLGLGYSCGHHRFIELANAMNMVSMFDDPAPQEYVSAYEDYLKSLGNKEWLALYNDGDEQTKNRLVNSFVVVQDYRSKSPKIVGLWNKFKEALQEAASKGQDFSVVLPSGRAITYNKCRYRRVKKNGKTESEVVADIMRNGRVQTSRLYGGLCTENLVQATARDAFRDCLLRLHEHGYKVALHVHDEAVVEVPESEAEFHRENIEKLMSVTPSWAPGLPVAAEANIAKRYSEGK
jgi:hypothetical protein